jgi:16S rRNA (cytosine1402-N4)-methyltransferase
MNPKAAQPAYELFHSLTEEELRILLVENADEPHARQIAKALKSAKPKTTTEVAETVRGVVKTFSPKVRAKEGDTPIRRVFQALRIAVNDEFGALDQLLATLPELLEAGGKAAILSFHSGEDRRVKKAFQHGLREGLYSEISPELIRPSPEEQRANPRSRPAKLRWSIKA